MTYLEKHQGSGFKVGDRVSILRAARSAEKGWANSWQDTMDASIGKTGTIHDDKGEQGFRVEIQYEPSYYSYYLYPYYILDPITPIPPVRLPKVKRTRAGLKVPCYAVMFVYGGDVRAVVDSVYTYGRNGDLADAFSAFGVAENRTRDLSYPSWIERAWVTVRLPRRKVG